MLLQRGFWQGRLQTREPSILQGSQYAHQLGGCFQMPLKETLASDPDTHILMGVGAWRKLGIEMMVMQ